MHRKSRKKIMVAGGAGFLGSHLCERLTAQGHDVLCVDNFITGARDNWIPCCPNQASAHASRCDGAAFGRCRRDLQSGMPRLAIHYQRDPVRTTKTSTRAINMLDLARRNDARVLQASTSEVYGDPEVHPQPEEYRGRVNPIGLRSCYDEGKRCCAETLFFDYHRQHGLAIKVVRIFNTYGPRMHPNDGRVVSNLIVQALRGESITLYGDGQQTRSFCYVDDLIEAMMRMMRTGPEITARSTSAIRASARSGKWRRSCSTSPGRPRRWSTSRCRRTTPTALPRHHQGQGDPRMGADRGPAPRHREDGRVFRSDSRRSRVGAVIAGDRHACPNRANGSLRIQA